MRATEKSGNDYGVEPLLLKGFQCNRHLTVKTKEARLSANIWAGDANWALACWNA